MSAYLPYLKVADRFDIRRGDALLVGSDLLAWAAVCAENGETLEPNRLIDQLLEKVGIEGTLLLPAFHFGFSSEGRYDIVKSRPVTGALPRAALKRGEFGRTSHPMHSFAVAGRARAELCAMTNVSSFGADSPFAWMRREHAKMWIVGLDYQGSFTFAHHAEELEDAPYRYLKQFEGEYVNANGVSQIKKYAMCVRDLERGVESDLVPLGLRLEEKSIASTQLLNGISFRWVSDLAAAYDVAAEDLKKNGGRALHRIRSGERTR